MPPDFHFIRPYWLFALLPLALLLWRLRSAGGNGRVWHGLVDPHLLPHLLSREGGRARRLPLVLLAAGWTLGVLALAGPAWERLPQPVYQAQAYRVLALDLSPSMNAQDLRPSRLARARFEVLDLLNRESEGQTALVAYGSEPFVVSPLTSDTATIAAQVPSLSGELLPVKGGRRADLALQQAMDLLRQASAPDGDVILITDGLDSPAAAGAAAQALRQAGYRLFVLGVGTAKGAPIPQADGGFVKDSAGAILLSALDGEKLRLLARQGGGRYVAAVAGDRDIDALMPDPAKLREGEAQDEDFRSDQWREQGPWLLLLLLPLAALGFRKGWLSPLAVLLLLPLPPPAQAFGWEDLWRRADQRAARAFDEGRHQEAAEAFRRPDWRAAARYQAGDYAGALEDLHGLQGAQADYNRGNALARMGELEQAIAAYDAVLAEQPDHADARHNRELLQRLLDQKQQQSSDQSQDRQGQQDQERQGTEEKDQSQAGSDDAQAQEQSETGRQEQAEQGEQESGRQADAADQGEQSERQASQQDSGGEPPQQTASGEESADAESGEPGNEEPSRRDLLPQEGGRPDQAVGAISPDASVPQSEDRQALEMMLRRVEDDPGGLLRQRFLLQHLRRQGKL